MKFTLVHKEKNRAYFECSEVIEEGVCGPIDLSDRKKYKDGYTDIEEDSSVVRMICISDAHTHTERLVFPAGKCKDDTTGEEHYSIKDFMHIAGNMTTMAFGGNSASVQEYEHYLKKLAEYNNAEYEGLTNQLETNDA